MWSGGFDLSDLGKLGATLGEGLQKAREAVDSPWLGEVVSKAKAEAERLDRALNLDGTGGDGGSKIVEPGEVVQRQTGRQWKEECNLYFM
jgi:hypothetical protein